MQHHLECAAGLPTATAQCQQAAPAPHSQCPARQALFCARGPKSVCQRHSRRGKELMNHSSLYHLKVPHLLLLLPAHCPPSPTQAASDILFYQAVIVCWALSCNTTSTADTYSWLPSSHIPYAKDQLWCNPSRPCKICGHKQGTAALPACLQPFTTGRLSAASASTPPTCSCRSSERQANLQTSNCEVQDPFFSMADATSRSKAVGGACVLPCHL